MKLYRPPPTSGVSGVKERTKQWPSFALAVKRDFLVQSDRMDSGCENAWNIGVLVPVICWFRRCVSEGVLNLWVSIGS